MHLLRRLLIPAAALAVLAAPSPAAAACDDPNNICVEPAAAKWEPDKSLSSKQLKAKRKGASGTLSVKIEEGRGSVFIDGRFAGVAPVNGIELGPGKHDVQVRDGGKILVEGTLNIPKGANVKATVKYP